MNVTASASLRGGCHCAAIGVRFDTHVAPGELPVRVCGCSFCLRHRPLYTSDPRGHLTIVAARSDLLPYRFGLRLADFLLCARCGVFVAAFEPRGLAVLNAAVLERAAELTATPVSFTAYDTEDVATRSARRAKAWTPAALDLT